MSTTTYHAAQGLKCLLRYCFPDLPGSFVTPMKTQGYVWGKPVTHILEVLPDQTAGFDVVLMSDLIFNHSQVWVSAIDLG